MTASKAPSYELSPKLIQEYRDALERVNDPRLVVLLTFNAFDEVLKVMAAWRLSCALEDLPGPVTNSTSLLLDIVLTKDEQAKKLREKAKKLSELRNEVAHQFHKQQYKVKLAEFVKKSGIPWPTSKGEQHAEFMRAVAFLALDIALHLHNLPDRPELPTPMLSVDLHDALPERRRRTSAGGSR